jgi:hypothetical protein
MAGNFTRLHYDQKAYDEQVGRSTYALGYRLNPYYSNNCTQTQRCQKKTHIEPSKELGDRVQTESMLKGINNKNTKVTEYQHPIPLQKMKRIDVPDCYSTIHPEFTRLTYPSFEVKGETVKDMRMGYPLHDPQCAIFDNFSVNTRLAAKDGHRAIWQVPMSQDSIFPPIKAK